MKKVCSILLVLAMLCTALALASCETATDVSSADTSSEESVAPPTKSELLEAAFGSLESYLTPFADILLIDTEKFDSKAGDLNVSLSLDELSAMGQSVFGDESLKVIMDIKTSNGDLISNSVLHAAGDEVKFETYKKGDKQYIKFPELYEDKVFHYEDVMSSDEDGEQSGVILPTLGDDLLDILLKEDCITISEDGKTYTVTLAKADVGALLDLIEPLMGMGGGMGDIIDLGGTSEEPVEKPEPDSATFVLTIDSDTQALCTLSVKAGETALYDFNTTFSVLAGMTTITVKGNEEGAEIVSLSMTATETAVDLEGKLNMDGTLLEIDLGATKANDVCTIDGTLSASLDMSGMMLTIPFVIEGTVAVEGDTLKMGVSLFTSPESLLNIGMSAELEFTPGEVTVTLPFAESDVADYDKDEFDAKMKEVYPNASVLFGDSADVEDSQSVDYANEDYSIQISFFEDNSVYLSLSDLTYEKTDSKITFFKNRDEVFAIDYTLDSNGNFVIYGDTYETEHGDIVTDGYMLNVYTFYEDATRLDFYLDSEIDASLSMAFFCTTEPDTISLLLPDGSAVTYALEMNEDGSIITFLGETLYLETYEY